MNTDENMKALSADRCANRMLSRIFTKMAYDEKGNVFTMPYEVFEDTVFYDSADDMADAAKKVEGFITRAKETGLLEGGNVTADGEVAFKLSEDMPRR